MGLEFLTSATLNNMLGQHEALTLSYAGVWPLKQLQYLYGSYKQVLTSEGLTGFADGSYSWGKPGTQALEALEYFTHSTLIEAGAFYPVVRSRERNLTLSGLVFHERQLQRYPASSVQYRPAARISRQGGRRHRRRLQGINQFNVTFSQGIEGLGSTDNGNPLASRAAGRSISARSRLRVSRTQPLPGRFSAYAACTASMPLRRCSRAEQCGYGGRFFGRAFDPSADARRQLFRSTGRAALRPAANGAADYAGAALRLHRLRHGFTPASRPSARRIRHMARRRARVCG